MSNERKECGDNDTVKELLAALVPFVSEFLLRRDEYIHRYPRNPDVGSRNFDAMPDKWPMENTTFPMGVYRRAVKAYFRAGNPIRIEEPAEAKGDRHG